MAQYAASAAQSLTPISPVVASHQSLASSISSARGPGPQPSPPPPGDDPANLSGAGGAANAQHKRVYQACIPCRRRKVRCDLGSVDNPHDPPCVRCRRESKQCYFSATRRKRKADDGSLVDEADVDADDYVQRNGRKQVRTSDSPSVSVNGIDRRLFNDAPLTPGGNRGRALPLKRPGQEYGSAEKRTGEFGAAEPNTPMENLEARTVMRREVYGPHDALDLLYKAATDNTGHRNEEQHAPAASTGKTHAVDARPDSISRQTSQNHYGDFHPHQTKQEQGGTGETVDSDRGKPDISSKPGYTEALKAWNRFRFVRAGWFTAQEAIECIDYYYAYLSPLTPISPPTFRNPATHSTLLTEEPILTVTLLTIASRYRRMPGTGGHCRSHAIHEQLWTYLRGMIERTVWGQEAFGGGFCGSGMDETQNSSTAPWRGLRRGSLRTLGTIESLMILTEWHPRALHFPPSEATDELMVPPYDAPFTDDNQGPPGNFGGRRIEGWLEPAWRSDRMCWMLLSIGMGLAYELGVFDDIDDMLATNALARPEYEDESYRLRAHRIKRLLLIYQSQLAGRLGWTNMVPENLRRAELVAWKKRPQSVEGTTPATNPSSISNAFSYIPDLELDDQIIYCWAGISSAMQHGNDKLFKTRKHTTDIIRSEEYIELLKEFQPMLKSWWNNFDRLTMPQYIRHILTIEYEYVRIYINSLSLQAVVERSTNMPNVAPSVSSAGNAPGVGPTAQGPQLSPRSQNYLGKVPLPAIGGFGPEDQEYVKEVVDGSRNLLKTVVEGLLPGDYLKHAPVRTYFRIISGAMFLLKTFALGATKTDVEISITLMDRTVDALRNCVVDDVHLGIRFADMLETLTSRLRNRFIHAPPPRAPSVADGKSPAPNHHELGNGSGTNGLGVGHQLHGPEVWPKMKDGLGIERSSTPANISATPWDANAGSFPYPNGSTSVFNPGTPGATVGLSDGLANLGGNGPSASAGDNGLFDSDWNNPATEMWYLPPGPAFFQNMENPSVTMTAEGVNVGGLDLLEYMAIDPIDHPPFMDGNGF